MGDPVDVRADLRVQAVRRVYGAGFADVVKGSASKLAKLRGSRDGQYTEDEIIAATVDLLNLRDK